MIKLKILLGILFLWNTAIGQESSVREFPMNESSLLWKITGDGVHGDAFLFGTVHIIPESQYYFPDTLMAINTSVDVVMLEVDLTADMSGLMNKLMLEEGSFFDFFTEEQEDSIFTWAEKTLELTEAQFRMTMNKMKPFVISTMAASMGTSEPVESYDMNISSHARKADIPVEGLETFEDQINIFESYSAEEQTEMVMTSIRDDSTTLAMQEEMVDLYLGQNIDSLFIFATSDSQHSLDQKKFLDDRNEKWIPIIANSIAKQNVLIAVGAGHLGGPLGVVRLLERKGYTLTPVKL